MAKAAPVKPTTTEKADKAIADKAAEQAKTMSPEALLAAELKRAPDDHLNYEEAVTYKVSTGTLNMDIETGGGLSPGLVTVSGPYESGKTSFTLECMKNMLNTVPNSRGFYIKAEGRLSAEIQARSGIRFVFGKWTKVDGKDVYDTSDWVDGTCFVLETNIWEFALNTLRTLVSNNPLKKRYFFFIDSMDGMTLKDDLPKDVGTANRVAGGPLLTKQFLQKMGNAMGKRGHISVVAGQVSAAIQLDPYTASAPRSGPGGGGNAKDHWSNHIFIFKGKTQGDYILESPNEKSNVTVTYPVRYGRTGGDSVWREYEIVDMLLMFKQMTKSGSWLKLSDALIKELAEKGLKDVPATLQGVDQWRKELEKRKDLTDYLFNRFRAMVASST